ncbi:MAG TPA: RNHCP domain-containing protein [Ktedonobacteraceae bacterium]|nr:RNHCP domain-containing protein [Ktedonobacteraceae bacterium]
MGYSEPQFSKIIRRKRHHSDEEPFSSPPLQEKRRPRRVIEGVFKCRHCRQFIGPVPSGGSHRNHCPFCLFSRHVDDRVSGDRASICGSSMQPIGRFQRSKGEYVVVHRCLGCGFERFNRIAADDDFELVLSLSALPPCSGRELKAQRLAREYELELETL